MKKNENAKLPISVVIPTFSEEIALPHLLESLEKQLIGPSEVIVADAFSPDRTREIAKKHGCIVVDGGRIATGRNNGARIAKNEYLLFLDADTSLPSTTILIEAFTEFLKSEIDIASAGFKPEKVGSSPFGLAVGTVLFGSWNAIRKVQSLTQRPFTEGGAFVLVKKRVFEHLGGFNPEIGVGEDMDFFVRAVKRGYKYKHLTQKIYTSTRRYDSPRKASKSLVSSLMQGGLLLAGVYAGSKLYKRIISSYGRLGGGEGKDPNDTEF